MRKPYRSDLTDAQWECSLPTGLGKTSVIPIWLIALANGGGRRTLPRRLVYVVNRRTVVDQATREAEKLRSQLLANDRPDVLAQLAGALAELAADPTAPPAVVNGKLFVGTILGEVCCLSAASGEVLWRDALGEPVIFQPAVVGGRFYAATGAGSLFSIETGDPRDDGCPMWGGSAAHNGMPS